MINKNIFSFNTNNFFYLQPIRIITRKIGKLFVGQHEAPFAIIKYTKALRELDNKIIECKFENNGWVFMRERQDKSYPNSYNTAMGKII